MKKPPRRDVKTLHTIIIGDARTMKELADGSIHLIVTSPPYWQLKDYGIADQIGFHHTYEEYINNLNLVWSEAYRVLHPGCRMCINIGDQFARSAYYGRYKVIPIRTEITKFCEIIGFDYLGAVIWQKLTTCRTSGGASIMGSYPYPRNGIVKLDYEFILLFKKTGDQPLPTRDAKEASRLTKEEWNSFFTGHWSFPGEKQDVQSAVFPEELPRRLIRMFSFVGETVLDPFLGSGTTSLAAKNTGRNSVGYEISGAALPIIKEKLAMDTLLEDADFSIIQQTPAASDFTEKIRQLPYIFRDPVRIQRTGHNTGPPRPAPNQLFSVKGILDPDRILLNNGLVVQLLGVREDPLHREEAVEFLKEATTGQKVYLLFEDGTTVDGPAPACYLHLRNRTFINAHLIRSGFVFVDDSTEYRHKRRFLRYRKEARGEAGR